MKNLRFKKLITSAILAVIAGVFLLSGTGDAEETPESIRQHISDLESENPDIAREAANKLLSTDKKRSVPLILEVLKSRETGDLKKCNTIHLLGRMGSEEAVPELINLLDDKKPIIRKEAIRTLGKIKAKGAIHKLRNIVKSEADPSVLNEAVRALGDMEAEEAVDDLIEIVQNSYLRRDGYGPVLRESAIEALGKLKSNKATALLIDKLTAREDLTIKDKAVWALGEIGAPDSIEALKLYLERLEAIEPTDKMIHYKWLESVEITKKAIEKVKNKNQTEEKGAF